MHVSPYEVYHRYTIDKLILLYSFCQISSIVIQLLSIIMNISIIYSNIFFLLTNGEFCTEKTEKSQLVHVTWPTIPIELNIRPDISS